MAEGDLNLFSWYDEDNNQFFWRGPEETVSEVEKSLKNEGYIPSFIEPLKVSPIQAPTMGFKSGI